MVRSFCEVEKTEKVQRVSLDKSSPVICGFKPGLLMSNPVFFPFSHNRNFVNILSHPHNQF